MWCTCVCPKYRWAIQCRPMNWWWYWLKPRLIWLNLSSLRFWCVKDVYVLAMNKVKCLLRVFVRKRRLQPTYDCFFKEDEMHWQILLCHGLGLRGLRWRMRFILPYPTTKMSMEYGTLFTIWGIIIALYCIVDLQILFKKMKMSIKIAQI